MSRKSWYVFCLWLPLFLPALWLWILFLWPAVHDISTLQDVNKLFLFLSAGAAIMWFPYLLFLLCVLLWAKPRSANALAKVSWLIPLLFFPFTIIGMLLLGFLSHGQDSFMGMIKDLSNMALFILPFCLGFGYFYVVLVHSLTWLLQKATLIRD